MNNHIESKIKTYDRMIKTFQKRYGKDFDEFSKDLKNSELISRVEIKTIDEIRESDIYKVRYRLIPSKHKLEIKFMKTKEQILYSYQLFSNAPIIR